MTRIGKLKMVAAIQAARPILRKVLTETIMSNARIETGPRAGSIEEDGYYYNSDTISDVWSLKEVRQILRALKKIDEALK